MFIKIIVGDLGFFCKVTLEGVISLFCCKHTSPCSVYTIIRIMLFVSSLTIQTSHNISPFITPPAFRVECFDKCRLPKQTGGEQQYQAQVTDGWTLPG